MAAKKKTSADGPGFDDIEEGQVWWASGKGGVVSDKHFFTSIQIHSVMNKYCQLSIGVMGDSSGIITVKREYVLKLRDKLLAMKL